MTLLLTFLLMLGVVAAMAIGVLMGRKPIAGSCGGLRNLGADMQCDICGGEPQRCAGSEDR